MTFRKYIDFPFEDFEAGGLPIMAWVFCQADSGGVDLMACPVMKIETDRATFLQLVADLEAITWEGTLANSNIPSDEATMWIVEDGSSPPSEAPIAWDRGKLFNGIWVEHAFLRREYAELSIPDQIERILVGKLNRLIL